jgi:hypothetical protein
MGKDKIAERILSLVMEPTEASSLVGDLLETGASRSAIWFWLNVFRTLAAAVWGDCKGHPLFVVGIAFLGTLVHFATAFIGGLLCALFIIAAGALSSHPHLAQEHPWLLFPGLIVTGGVAPLYAGRWIARFSLGKDAAVCVAMVIIAPIVFNGMTALLWCGSSLLGVVRVVPETYSWWNWQQIACIVPYLVGAALVRRRHLAAAS